MNYLYEHNRQIVGLNVQCLYLRSSCLALEEVLCEWDPEFLAA